MRRGRVLSLDIAAGVRRPEPQLRASLGVGGGVEGVHTVADGEAR